VLEKVLFIILCQLSYYVSLAGFSRDGVTRGDLKMKPHFRVYNRNNLKFKLAVKG
jgi:hypothetical protein